MIIGTTPTFTLKIKKATDVDLRVVNNIYVTLKQGNITLTKTGNDLNIVDSKTVSFTLTQAESLDFVVDKIVEIQINWTFMSNGITRRAATKVLAINLDKQLLK